MSGPVTSPSPALAPGEIFGETLALFFRRLHIILILSVLPSIAFGAVFYLLVIAYEDWLRQTLNIGRGYARILLTFASIALSVGVGLGTASGPMTTAARAFRVGQPVRLGDCLHVFWRRLPARMVVGSQICAGLLMPLAIVAIGTNSARAGLIITILALGIGSYAIGRWGLSLPSLSAETMQGSATRRAVFLSQGYRWQLAGTAFLLLVMAALISGLFAVLLITGSRLFMTEVLNIRGFGTIAEWVMIAEASLGVGVMSALVAIGLALMHARMVEIKEPPDISEMIHVFE